MSFLKELGFIQEDKIWVHERAPIRAVVYEDGAWVKLVYKFTDDFAVLMTSTVKNEKHEVLMGLTAFKEALKIWDAGNESKKIH